MRFGMVLTAVASLFLVTVLISYPLETVLIPTLGFYWAPTVGALVSVLGSSLIVGYVFSRKMFGGRKEAIAKICARAQFRLIGDHSSIKWRSLGNLGIG